MNKKTKGLLTSLVVIVFLMIGITLAIWVKTHTQNKANVINTGCFATTYVEKSNAINLNNALPQTDAKGLTNDPFVFTITNLCNKEANYAINLEILEGTTLDVSYLKVAVNSDKPQLLTAYSATTAIINGANAYNLLNSNLNSAQGANAESATYSIRLWLDENTPISEMEKYLAAKVVVTDISATNTNLATPLFSGDISKTQSCDANGENCVIDTGNNVSYDFYENGNLVIKGQGETKDYAVESLLIEIINKYLENSPEFIATLSEAELTQFNETNGLYILTIMSGNYLSASKNLTNNLKKNISFTDYDSFIKALKDNSLVTNEEFYTFMAKLRPYCPIIKAIEIKEGITGIGSNVLNYIGSSNMDIILPESLVYINGLNLTDARIDLSNSFNLLQISPGAFAFDDLTSLTWPTNAKITSIPIMAFGFTKINNMVLPNSIETLGTSAFLNSEIKSITLPTNSKFTIIPDSAFAKCTQLTEVIIPENVTQIDQDAFTDHSSSLILKFKGAQRTIGNNVGGTFNLSGFNVTWNN